jgi:hypothetical protein
MQIVPTLRLSVIAHFCTKGAMEGGTLPASLKALRGRRHVLGVSSIIEK